jgi:hypothetical protein
MPCGLADDDHAEGGICLLTAATNRLIVHSPGDI